MNEKQKALYIAEGGNRCPYCRTYAISGDVIDVESGSESSHAFQDVVCLECQKKWTDEYTLTSVAESLED